MTYDSHCYQPTAVIVQCIVNKNKPTLPPWLNQSVNWGRRSRRRRFRTLNTNNLMSHVRTCYCWRGSTVWWADDENPSATVAAETCLDMLSSSGNGRAGPATGSRTVRRWHSTWSGRMRNSWRGCCCRTLILVCTIILLICGRWRRSVRIQVGGGFWFVGCRVWYQGWGLFREVKKRSWVSPILVV